MKSAGFIFVYVVAVVIFIASLFDMGPEAVVVTSLEGFRLAIAFAIAWFTAGGNMIPNVGWQQATEAWAASKTN